MKLLWELFAVLIRPPNRKLKGQNAIRHERLLILQRLDLAIWHLVFRHVIKKQIQQRRHQLADALEAGKQVYREEKDKA